MAERVRFIIDASAQGALAAFQAVDRGLSNMGRGLITARRAAALLGTAFSVRAFGSFISDSIKIEKLTQSQAKAIGEARTELGKLGDGFGDLARTVATELAPALATAGKFWREFLFPTSGESHATELDAVNKRISELAQTIFKIQSGKFAPGRGTSVESLRAEIDKLVVKMHELQDATEDTETTIGQADLDKKLGALGVSTSYGKTTGMNQLPDYQRAFLTGVERPAEIKMPADFKQWPKEIDEAVAAMDSFADAQRKAKREAEQLTDALGRGLRDTFVDAILGVETSFSDLLKRMAAELLTSQLFGALSSLAGGPATFLGAMFAGARAGGGPVSAGRSYLVGEKGPEIFTPNQGGQIVANGAGGAAMSITNYNDFRGVDPSSVGRIGMMLERQKRETINAVRDLNNRGRL